HLRHGKNASEDNKIERIDRVLSVQNNSVNARVKGSDKTEEDKKKDDKKAKGEDGTEQQNGTIIAEELEEVVFVLQADGSVKKVVVRSGIQDINYIEVISGLKEGDEVITGPYNAISKTLKDGNKVKVVPKDKLFE